MIQGLIHRIGTNKQSKLWELFDSPNVEKIINSLVHFFKNIFVADQSFEERLCKLDQSI